MIRAKTLRELLARVPDDAMCSAYEGEDVGIVVYDPGKAPERAMAFIFAKPPKWPVDPHELEELQPEWPRDK